MNLPEPLSSISSAFQAKWWCFQGDACGRSLIFDALRALSFSRPPRSVCLSPSALSLSLVELRSVCKQQRESGKSLRGALVRKQGQLDDASSEASWLRAELGFIVGDM